MGGSLSGHSGILLSLSDCLKHARVRVPSLVAFGVFVTSCSARAEGQQQERWSGEFDVRSAVLGLSAGRGRGWHALLSRASESHGATSRVHGG